MKICSYSLNGLLQIQQYRNMPDNIKKAFDNLNIANFQTSIQYYEKHFSQSSQASQQKNSKKPTTLSSSQISNILHLSIAYMETGRFAQTKQLCERILAKVSYKEGENQDAYSIVVICMAHLGMYSQGLKMCDRGIEVNDKYWKVYYAKGYLLWFMERYEEAAENLGFAITKNVLNNPKSYILQAACFTYLEQYSNAVKSMHYARMAIKEQQNKNSKNLYGYEIKNIKNLLKTYQKYTKKLSKSQQQKQITPSQRLQIQIRLIRLVNKSILYNSPVSLNKNPVPNPKQGQQKQPLPHNNQIQNQLYAQNSSQNSELSTKIDKDCNFYEELEKIDELLHVKNKNTLNTIKSEVLEVKGEGDQGNGKIVCEWIRQKCSIF